MSRKVSRQLLESVTDGGFTRGQFFGFVDLPDTQHQRDGGDRVEDGGDEEGNAHHEGVAGEELDGDEHQHQAGDTAEHAYCPTLAGNIANRLGRGNIHQQGIVEDLRGAVTDLRQDEEEDADEDVTRLHEEEQRGEHHGEHGEDEKESLLAS